MRHATMSDREKVTEPIVDYAIWARRVLGWDAALPLGVTAVSFAIARLFNDRPPADILALVVLPLVAFLSRLFVGVDQIRSNVCGIALRRLQALALLVGLFLLVVVDFFIALDAFVPPQAGPPPFEIEIVCGVAIVLYFMLAILAMYPGRRRERARNVSH